MEVRLVSPEAREYLEGALDIIEAHSIMRGQLDFGAWRRDTMDAAGAAATPRETYEALRDALRRLGDRHSFFSDPEGTRRQVAGRWVGIGCAIDGRDRVVYWVDPDSPAEAAGLRVGDVLETPLPPLLPDVPVQLWIRRADNTLTIEAVPEERVQGWRPYGRRIASDLGYLEVPAFGGDGQGERGRAFAAEIQNAIREIERAPVRGWIVDLRRNPGGNMWPMLLGLGPIVGEGTWDVWESSEGRVRAGYRAGEAFLEWDGEGEGHLRMAEMDGPYVSLQENLPVAVLYSSVTASSGEFVALCFRGLERSRSFGEPTFGVPTCNESFGLPDGAAIYLTTALGLDRRGTVCDGPLEPDERVPIVWAALGSDDDAPLCAAIRWLHSSPSAEPAGVNSPV
jgi:carboxyl-terminal processing protease